MRLRTATTIAIVGILLALLLDAASFLLYFVRIAPSLVAGRSMGNLASLFQFMLYHLRTFLALGSILVFLFVLRSKQSK